MTAVTVTFAGSALTLDIAAFGDHLPLLVALLPPDRSRGRLRRRPDGSAANSCFRCHRPLMRFGGGSRFVVASVPLAVTPAWAALIAAQPDFRPAWGIAPAAATP